MISKNVLERIYYPIEPLYKEIRQHRTVTTETPQGVKTIQNIKIDTETILPENRDDLSELDKQKAIQMSESRMKQSVKAEALAAVRNEFKQS